MADPGIGNIPPDSDDSSRCSLDKDELETVEIYTPTFLWQTLGVWQDDFLGYTETLEEAEQVLQEYEICTGSKFIVSYKRVNFGKPFLELLHVKHKVIWLVNNNQDRSTTMCSNLVIPFDGVPFIFAGKKVFECRHGQDKGVGAKLRWKKLAKEKMKTDPKFKERAPRIQPSFKVGCKAQVHINHVIRFPQYEIVNNSAYWKRRRSGDLKLAMQRFPSTIQVSERFYITLTDPKHHTNHNLKDAEMARKAHNLRVQSQGNYKRVKRRKQQAVHTSDIPAENLGGSETNITHNPSVAEPSQNAPDTGPSQNASGAGPSQNASGAGPSQNASGAGPSQNAPVVPAPAEIQSQTGTAAAARCAKVLEKLIDATFMVENADKLLELERKASELLQETSTSIASAGRVVTQTDNTNTDGADKGGRVIGQKNQGGDNVVQTMPATESIECANFHECNGKNIFMS